MARISDTITQFIQHSSVVEIWLAVVARPPSGVTGGSALSQESPVWPPFLSVCRRVCKDWMCYSPSIPIFLLWRYGLAPAPLNHGCRFMPLLPSADSESEPGQSGSNETGTGPDGDWRQNRKILPQRKAFGKGTHHSVWVGRSDIHLRRMGIWFTSASVNVDPHGCDEQRTRNQKLRLRVDSTWFVAGSLVRQPPPCSRC